MSDTPRTSGRVRRPVAGHARLKSPHPFGQLAKLIAVSLAVVMVAGVGVAGFTVWDAARALEANSVDIGGGEDDKQLPPTLGEIEGGVNLLVAGTDSCEGQSTKLFPRCRHDPGGERNDVTMLVHISDDPRRVTVVSFPRDMLVPIPSCPYEDGTGHHPEMVSQPMNASYTYGGLACTVKTVEALTGEDIQFAASIRWTGVINMSDAVGGVDVCVAGEIYDRHTGLHLTKGTHNLQGARALQFLRIRHGIADGSDLGRISNQQQFMSSLVRKLQSDSVLANPAALFNLASTAMNQVTQKQLLLSRQLANPTRMVQIAMAVKDVAYKDIVFIQYPTRYVKATGYNKVEPVTDAAAILFKALRDNKPLKLTGKTSPGYSDSQTVKGEAVKPTAAPTPTASGSPTPTQDPDADAVELPGVISGTTAAQVTCTNPEKG